MLTPQDSLHLAPPSYTPARRDLDALVAQTLGYAEGSAEQRAATTVLLRVAEAAFACALTHLDRCHGPSRPLLFALLGRLLVARPSAAAVQSVLPLVTDSDLRAARQLIIALGKLPLDYSPLIEPALLSRLATAAATADQRALAEALGKVGGPAALPYLQASLEGPSLPPLLRPHIQRAVLRLERTASRPTAASPQVRGDVALPGSYPVVLRCRAGLTAVAHAELRASLLLPSGQPLTIDEPFRPGQPLATGTDGRLTFAWSRPLADLFALRTFSSLAIALPCPPTPLPLDDDAVASAVVTALGTPKTRRLLRELSASTPRYRLHFCAGAHHRALVLRIATAVRAAAPELRNDPKESPWQVEISETGSPTSPLRIELVPRRLVDPRFAYRLADVPAASHPPLAAALARLAAIGPNDTVWDPFVGSGSELIEAARLSPTARLYGSDLDESALASSRTNCAAAGLADRVQLIQADALTFTPPQRPTRIITNPPMGRRTRTGDLAQFLSAFIRHAATLLAPSGRLVWISPQPRLTQHCAQSAGLRLLSSRPIDLNGFWGQLEVWQRD